MSRSSKCVSSRADLRLSVELDMARAGTIFDGHAPLPSKNFGAQFAQPSILRLAKPRAMSGSTVRLKLLQEQTSPSVLQSTIQFILSTCWLFLKARRMLLALGPLLSRSPRTLRPYRLSPESRGCIAYGLAWIGLNWIGLELDCIG